MLYKCECGREFITPNSFNGHKSNCETHLKYLGKYEAYLKRRQEGYKHTKETIRKLSKLKKQYKLSQWISEKHICEACGKIMTEKFGSGRFCYRKCSNKRIHTNESKQKASETLKNNKNRKNIIEYNIRLENYNKKPNQCIICNKILDYKHRKNKICSKECHDKLIRIQKLELCAKQGTNLCGKGKRGYYKGYYCQSSWELAYVIYCLDHNIDIQRNKDGFKYILDGVERSYFPDFITNNGSYIEIKGYYDRKTREKEKQFPKDKKLIILKGKEMEPILEYVKNRYGKDFIKMYN